jgi:hypothetical protein
VEGRLAERTEGGRRSAGEEGGSRGEERRGEEELRSAGGSRGCGRELSV